MRSSVKPIYLSHHGREIINHKLPDWDFTVPVKIAQEEFDMHQRQMIVGPSRGGEVAMNVRSNSARLVLHCPA